MPGSRPFAALLLGLLYAAVSLAPCPPLAEPAGGSAPASLSAGHSHGPSATPPCHASADSARPPHTLVAPCPCGCDQRPAASPTAKLGPVLVAAAPRLGPVTAAFAVLPDGTDRLVAADLAAPDPVPRSA